MVTILIPGNHDHQHLKLCRLDALPYARVSDFFFPTLNNILQINECFNSILTSYVQNDGYSRS